jgi:transposase
MPEEPLSMMNQETFVHINDLQAQGWTIGEIAAETGFHRTTISKHLKHGPPPKHRDTPVEVMTDHWRNRIISMLGDHPRLQAISVHDLLLVEGFDGSYPTVVRAVRNIRGPRFKTAAVVSVPIYTDPGEEAQFDFCVLDDWAQRWGWDTPLRCFGMILSWSRLRIWWFTTSEDRHHTFEGAVRFFDHVGGVPLVCRTDRMGALGSSQGRRFRLHAPSIEFAAHYRMKIASCQAGDAKRKGKVERPFRQLQATFLPEVEAEGIPASIDELNTRAVAWLDRRVHAVESRTTGQTPAARFGVERGLLTSLPVNQFDTDYVEVRRVHNVLPFIEIDTNRYSVPPDALGHKVEIRRRVDSDMVEVRLAGRLIATHRLVNGRRVEVWDPQHRRAAESIALGRDLRLVPAVDPVVEAPSLRLVLDDGDYEVVEPDLGDRYRIDIQDDGGVSA